MTQRRQGLKKKSSIKQIIKTKGSKFVFIFGGAVILLFIIIISYYFYTSLYASNIYPNIKIAGVDVGGLKKDEAAQILSYKIDAVKNKDIKIDYHDKTWIIEPRNLSLDYEPEDSYQAAYSVGRGRSFFSNIFDRIKLLEFGINEAFCRCSYDIYGFV